MLLASMWTKSFLEGKGECLQESGYVSIAVQEGVMVPWGNEMGILTI